MRNQHLRVGIKDLIVLLVLIIAGTVMWLFNLHTKIETGQDSDQQP